MSKKELMEVTKTEGSKVKDERQMNRTKKCRIYKLMMKSESKVQAVRNAGRIRFTGSECVQSLY